VTRWLDLFRSLNICAFARFVPCSRLGDAFWISCLSTRCLPLSHLDFNLTRPYLIYFNSRLGLHSCVLNWDFVYCESVVRYVWIFVFFWNRDSILDVQRISGMAWIASFFSLLLSNWVLCTWILNRVSTLNLYIGAVNMCQNQYTWTSNFTCLHMILLENHDS